ncbi:heme biosynthesis HemY N-terminal domain-containing protein [Tahibacter amnicola]|uniref:Heme biosynthesis protein HemY n=1 Tax=Tahibacter amnicola TaxID=2976241 RepID=A0ABY6BE53_9GAMM|nr:heme biosynthesis HemY N-terminal domain-containing protein [Tahibacter amnicola]UXI68316.1 heme biosynthesis protein HemY [Tahibacter amnicola]
MKYWISGLLLVAAMLAAAYGYQWVAANPGYVLIRYGNTALETTLVLAIVALALSWAALTLAWRLARWPLRLWSRRARKKSRERLAAGLVALTEGRYQRAEKELARATQYHELRAPALLAAARAALAQGESARVDAVLGEAAAAAPAAALTLRARLKREQGEHAQAFELLAPEARTNTLVPAAWVEYIEAALAIGNADAAFAALTPLARTQSLSHTRLEAIEARVIAAALSAQTNAEDLNTLWASLSRGQRRIVPALVAYATRIAALGQPLAGMSEIEAYLRKDWSDPVVLAYAELPGADAAARLRTAESWLKAHPHSPALLVALGRLCAAAQVWGKGREYLERALALHDSALAWEALADCVAGDGDATLATACYRNALRSARGEPVPGLAQVLPRAVPDTRALIGEERSEHGVPRLPGSVG